MLVLWVNLLVLKLFLNLYVLWAVINLFFLQFTMLLTVVKFVLVKLPIAVFISTKPVSALISSEPVKSFVICKPVCFTTVSMAKEFNSVNYCLVTCTEHLVNVDSSVVKKSVVSYRTACPVDFDIIVQTINLTLLFTYHCVSFKIPHHITPSVISILELPLHSAR